MKLRHRLIRWLAAGDTILLNFDRDELGWIRPRNLGEVLLSNVALRVPAEQYGLKMGGPLHRPSQAELGFDITTKQGIMVDAVGIDCRAPGTIGASIQARGWTLEPEASNV